MSILGRIVPVLAVALLCSCKAYKQDIMFRFDDDFTEEDVSQLKESVERNYQLKPNDRLRLDVFTNDGERLIDPNFEIAMLIGGQGGQQLQQQRGDFEYIIQADSNVVFPLVGNMNLVGSTLYEAELTVAEAFEEFYEDSFVKLRISNRRVIVLGSPGGQVIPIENENTELLEVLALAQGVDRNSKANNIRLLRGKEVFYIDLTTITGMQNSNMVVFPGDVIYVEPWRRPWVETLRDVSPIVSIISSLVTLAFVIQNF